MLRALALSLLLVSCAPGAEPPTGQVGSVVGGRPSLPSEMESTVAILDGTTFILDYQDAYCTGTMIAPRLTLTAAHCVDFQSAGSVRVAGGYLGSGDFGSADVARVERIIVHEDYDPALLNHPGTPEGLGEVNDIALLVLETPMTALKPAPILPMDRVGELMPPGSPSFVSGYGQTDNGTHGTLYLADVIVELTTATEILTTVNDDEGDTCFGDSGGPLYVNDATETFVSGVTSRVRDDANVSCGEGGIYTLASAYLDWIATRASDVFMPEPSDGGVSDGGQDAGPDAGDADAGFDGGVQDGGDDAGASQDAGTDDGGTQDAGNADGGSQDAGSDGGASQDDAGAPVGRPDANDAGVVTQPPNTSPPEQLDDTRRRPGRGCSISYPG